MNENMSSTNIENKSKSRKIISVLVIVALVLMIPVFIYNSIFLVKKATAKDNKPPVMFGYVSQYIPSDEFESFGMKKNDLVLFKSVDPADVAVGDIISFMKDAKSDTIVIQKVSKMLTNSDGELIGWEILDFNGFKSVVLISNLVGEYNGNRIPVIGGVANFMGSPVGIAICIAIPLALLVVYEIISRKKDDKATEDEKAELMTELEALRKAKAEADANCKNQEPAPETTTEENPENKDE